MMIKPYRECPCFDKCNVNNCPLHPSYPNLLVDSEDKEQKCSIEKGVAFIIDDNSEPAHVVRMRPGKAGRRR